MEKTLKKPVITREQAEAIEHFKKEHQEKLGDMSLREFYDALRFGYEVEPDYKVGDWIYQEATKTIAKITGFNSEGDRFNIDHKKIVSVHISTIRHATPKEIAIEKERIFFENHGRKPWELKFDDILRSSFGIDKVWHVHDDGRIELSGSSEKFTISAIKEMYRVACFAHERLDVKTNE